MTWQKPKRLQERFWPDFSGEDVHIVTVCLSGDIFLLMGFVSKGWHYIEVHQGHAMGKPGILEDGAVWRSKRQRDLAHVDAVRGA